MQFRLNEEDRQRLGCPEWLEFDFRKLSFKEAIALQKSTDFKSVEDLFSAFWKPALGKDTDPTGLVVDYEAVFCAVWLALRRAGVKVPYEELDFEARNIDYKLSDYELQTEEETDPKDSSTPPTTSS